MNTTQPIRPQHAASYSSHLPGIALLCLHRWRDHLTYAEESKRKSDMDNHDLCAAKAQAYHEVLSLITGFRDEPRIVESVASMA